MEFNDTLTITKWPSVKAVNLDDLVNKYSATFFQEALCRYIVLSQHTGASLTGHQLEQWILYTNLPFTTLPMYHKRKFINTMDSKFTTLDVIHVWPERQSKQGTLIPVQFDTALLHVGQDGEMEPDYKVCSSSQ